MSGDSNGRNQNANHAEGENERMKNNGRYAKSLFRIGLDALQNILFNIKLPDKLKTFNNLIDLLSCA